MRGLLILLSLSAVVSSTLVKEEAGTFYSCNYVLVTGPLSREAAAEHCDKNQGTLALVKSDKQNQETVALLAEAGLDTAWIGLFLTAGERRWDDGTELKYSKLLSEDGIPASGANVLAASNGYWLATEEKVEAAFICSISREFMVVSELLTRKEGAARCEEHDTRLARVGTYKQARTIRRLINSEGSGVSSYTWFWVGGENPTATGAWQWSDGSTAFGFKWEKDVVSSREGPLYVALNKRSGRSRPLHGYFINPVICQCTGRQDAAAATPRAQSDYGQINSEGKYVPLFRSTGNKLRVVGLEHSHAGGTTDQGVLSYVFHSYKYTHGAAQSYCQAGGGNLACPRNAIQQSLILQAIRGNAWLGVVDVDEDGVYTCLGDGDGEMDYSNWYHRFGYAAVPEPDNMTDRMKPGAAYVQILFDPERQWRHGKWIDRGAPQYEFVIKSGFVCENRRIRR